MQNLWSKEYMPKEWAYLRWCLATIWVTTLLGHLYMYDDVPLSVGICQWISCDFFVGRAGKIMSVLAALVAISFYTVNKHMVAACFSLGILSALGFTIEESNGILNRGGMLTALFFAHGVAFLVSGESEYHKSSVRAVRYSVQIVVAAYWLASVSKLETSGLQWVSDGKFIPLQVMKSFSTHYFTFGNEGFMTRGEENVVELISNSLTTQAVLLFSLTLEFMTPLAIIGRRWALIVGFLLVSMHVGIAIIMGIVIWSIFTPMIITLINPIYLISMYVISFYRKLKMATTKK
jgi:hypothetical protein